VWYNADMSGKAYRQSQAFKAQIRERDGNRCQLCGCGLGDVCDRHMAPVSQLDVAHIVPWPEGASTPDNLCVMCHPCNKRYRNQQTRLATLSIFTPSYTNLT